MQRRRDWSTLPFDAVHEISSRLPNDADYVRLRSVCTSWRSTTPKRSHLPWLIVRYSPHRHPITTSLRLCNFPNTHLFEPHLLPDQGVAQNKFTCGSSRGWIALLHHGPGISLHNPFTGLHIPLPPLADLPVTDRHGNQVTNPDPDFSLYGSLLAKNVVLSSDPRVNDCVVMALCHNREWLIYCQPGAASWTNLQPPLFTDIIHQGAYQDIIFFKGYFYSVSRYRVFICDIGRKAEIIELLPVDPLFSDGRTRPGPPPNTFVSYLVVSDGDLWLVARMRRNGELSFEVFRIDLIGGHRLRLVKLDTLGGRALFLHEDSMSVSVGSSSWCKGNCIYYIGMYGADITVYKIEDGSRSVIACVSDDNEHENYWELHWLTPSLC